MITKKQIENRKKEIAAVKKCGKVRYMTKMEAKKAMKTLNLHNINTESVRHKMTEIYFHEPCMAYHLTSKEKLRVRSFKHFKTN